jgi:hypothetical protein
MKTYVANIVSNQLIIEAEDEGQAEEKYSAFFNGDPCPCGKDECDCVTEQEDVFHYMEEE